MSPEQARGNPVDHRADVWAFGVVMYEMLTGARAFEAQDAALTLAEVMKSEPKWDSLPSDVPPVVRAFLVRCLRKEPTERVRDLGDVRLALEGAFDTASVSASYDDASALRRGVVWALATLTLTVSAALVAWSLKPAQNNGVVRFVHDLPEDQDFSGIGGPLMAISRDGRRFTYTANGQLYLRSMDEMTATPISGTEAGALHPTFSPDGSSIAYWSGGELKKIGVDGGVPVVIANTPLPYGLDWTGNGTLLYASEQGVMEVVADGGAPQLVIEGRGMFAARMLPQRETERRFSRATGLTTLPRDISCSCETGRCSERRSTSTSSM